MRFDIVTLFPGYFASPLGESLVGRAVENGILDVHLVDLRDFSDDPHRKVDDEPYGGGPGMVLTAPPVFAAVEALRSEAGAPPYVVFLSPQGRRFDAGCARELAARPRVALVCGRYEGIDERTRAAGLFDDEISLGDFVLSGGEAAALAILEAVSRYLPGVVKDAASVSADSFEDGLLDHPHYSRPRSFKRTRRAGGALLRPSRGNPAVAARAAVARHARKASGPPPRCGARRRGKGTPGATCERAAFALESRLTGERLSSGCRSKCPRLFRPVTTILEVPR